MAAPTTTFVSQYPRSYDPANLQYETNQVPDPNILEGRDYNMHDQQIRTLQRVIGTGAPTGTLMSWLQELDDLVGTGIVQSTAKISTTERDVAVAAAELSFNVSSTLDGVLNDAVEYIEEHRHTGGSGATFDGYPTPIFVDNEAVKTFVTLPSRTLASGQNKSTVFIGARNFTGGVQTSGQQGDADDLFMVTSVDTTGNPQLMLNVNDNESQRNRVLYAGISDSTVNNRGIAALGGFDGVLLAPGSVCTKHRIRQNADGTYITEGHIPHSANFIRSDTLDGPLAFLDASYAVSGAAPSGAFSNPDDPYMLYQVAPIVFQRLSEDVPGPATGNGGPGAGEWGPIVHHNEVLTVETGSPTGSLIPMAYTTNVYPENSWMTIIGPQINVNGGNIVNAVNIQINNNFPPFPQGAFPEPGRGGINNRGIAVVPNPQQRGGANDNLHNQHSVFTPGGTAIVPTASEKGTSSKINFAWANKDFGIANGANTNGVGINDIGSHITDGGYRVRDVMDPNEVTRLETALLKVSAVTHPVSNAFANFTVISGDGIRNVPCDTAALELISHKLKPVRDYRSGDGAVAYYHDVDNDHVVLVDPLTFEGARCYKNKFRLNVNGAPALGDHDMISPISFSTETTIDKVTLSADFTTAASNGGTPPTFRFYAATLSNGDRHYISSAVVAPAWANTSSHGSGYTNFSDFNMVVPAGYKLGVEVTDLGTLPATVTGMPYKFVVYYNFANARLPQTTI